MRITMSTLFDRINEDLQRINSDLQRVTTQITSGKKINAISDDPLSLTSILSLRTDRSEILQYQRNIITGTNMISATDTVLNQIQSLVEEAKKVAVLQGGSGTVADRLVSADYVHGLFEQALSLANTQFDNKFIFGGYKTAGYTTAAPAPFTVDQAGNVVYNGDPDNNLAIRINQRTTMEISINGQSGLMDTDIFTYFKNLEDGLRGLNYTQVIGVEQATNTTALLNSGSTGLSKEALLTTGSFDVTVTDHTLYPPIVTIYNIAVDVTTDTPASVAAKIAAVGGGLLSASWNASGNLEIQSTDPALYTVDVANDTSNFLVAAGVTSDTFQDQAINQAYKGLAGVWDDLAARIIDFGMKANRLNVQDQIHEKVLNTTEDSLEKMENTDITKAALELKSLETAYEAALSAAAKTMQLSLVNYL